MNDTAFWIDEDYDQAHASDGVSRYGAYVRDRTQEFAECWDGMCPTDHDAMLAEFASTAWRTATGPIMAPGYVRYHPRITGASLARSGWDSSLTATVDLVVPWPAQLAASRDWQRGAWWRDWPTEYRGGVGEVYRDPTEEDVTKRPYLLASATLTFPVPTATLPGVPVIALTSPRLVGDLVNRAQETVAALVQALNTIVSPVIETLDHR